MQSRMGVLFLKLRLRSARSSRRDLSWPVPAAGAFKRSNHVEKLDFAAPDPVPRIDGNAPGTTARFSRRRLYRRTTLQPRVPGLYELVLPGAVGPASRGTRDQRHGAGRTGNRTDRIRGPPACGKTCRARCRPAPHAGKVASNGKAPNAKASNTKKIAAPDPAPQAPAMAAVTPERVG